MLHGKRILLIITGGIAAYKCLELIRRLSERGCMVTPILTKAAKEFITPLSVASLCRTKVYDNLFDLVDEAQMGHIELSRAADLLVVAPATADVLAKMASGMANDLATTALLATDKPVLIAPAMNVRMWLHKATQRNLATLRNDGVEIVGPNDGDMACGEFGPGRMAEPEEILEAIERILGSTGQRMLAGKKVMVTAGPTHEPIDPVRYIGNRSSGRQGYALATAAVMQGADTILISGPTNLPAPSGVRTVSIQTADEMLRAVEDALPVDIAIFTAAVADWRIAHAESRKLKKLSSGAPPALTLVENPDILYRVAHHPTSRPPLVVGFAAETDNVLANAQTKLQTKGCDVIVANDVNAGVMGGPNNRVHVISRTGTEAWPELSKEEVAQRLIVLFSGMVNRQRKAAE